MTRKEQVSNGFTEMMKGFWGNQDLEVPDFEEPCEDAISRILKRMWNCRGEHTTSIDKVKMEQIIRENLPSVTPQKMGRWIPVSERLPESDGYYLVTEKSGRVGTYVFHKEGNSEEYWKRCAVAWQPLPEPYKAESEVAE